MTEQEQLQRLKAFVCDVIRDDGCIGSPGFIYESAINYELIVFNGGDEDQRKIADWLQPTPAEIDDIVKKGGGPV